MNKSLFLCPYCPHCWINLKPKIKYQQRESPVHSNNCHFHAVLSPRGGNWNTNYTFMKTMILMKVTIFPLVFRYGLFRNGFHHTDEKSIFSKKHFVYIKSKLKLEDKTSQELGNCPMGQREALLKERLYWKEGFIERKALLKERLLK